MLDSLKLLIRSGHSLVSVETRDEPRAAAIVRQACEDLRATLHEWSVTTGLVQTRPSYAETGVERGKAAPPLVHVLEQKSDNVVYLFKDLGPHCKDAYIQRLLRDIAGLSNPTVVLVDYEPLPDAARRLAVPLKLDLPDCAELEAIVRDTFRRVKGESLYKINVELTKGEFEQVVHTLRGLTGGEAARVVALAIHDDNSFSATDMPRIVEAKRNLLQASGCLEAIAVNVAVDEIGGLDNLKRWLAQRRDGMTARARQFGLDSPRGILLLGVQGCGKSLCAKMVAADWKLPLLRLDPGVLYQKFVGETENRLRESLGQAEKTAPIVLWIDEIEKAFASAAAESADGGLSQRMFGTLLSWMQDHRSPIFMVATANNIAALPPELMRKGRFDEVFFVDLPIAESRRKVLEIHLLRRKRKPADFALDELTILTAGFSGAEIEQLVVSAMYRAFAEGVELSDSHIRDEAKSTRPLSVLMHERVVALRQWAEGRCVPAD
jgi:AAA+ superfamily predicted ATPase